MYLKVLPGEIWEIILSYLPHVSTLGRLLCTSRYLRDVCYAYASYFYQREPRYIPAWWLIRFSNVRTLDRVMCLSLEEVHAVSLMPLRMARIRMSDNYVMYFLTHHNHVLGSYVEINGAIGWDHSRRCVSLALSDHVPLLPAYPTLECRCRHVPQLTLPTLRTIRFLTPMRFPTRDYDLYSQSYRDLFTLINMNPTVTSVEQVGFETPTWAERIQVGGIGMLTENRSMRTFHLGIRVEDLFHIDRIYPNLESFTVMYTGTSCIPLIFRLMRDRHVHLIYYPEDAPPCALERYVTMSIYN